MDVRNLVGSGVRLALQVPHDDAHVPAVRLEPDVENIAQKRDETDEPVYENVPHHLHPLAPRNASLPGKTVDIPGYRGGQCIPYAWDQPDNGIETEADIRSGYDKSAVHDVGESLNLHQCLAANGIRAPVGMHSRFLTSGDDIDGMNDAGYESKQRQKYVDPEMLAYANLEEYAKGRQDHREYDFHQVAHGTVLRAL